MILCGNPLIEMLGNMPGFIELTKIQLNKENIHNQKTTLI
jgi:hypothetical protein